MLKSEDQIKKRYLELDNMEIPPGSSGARIVAIKEALMWVLGMKGELDVGNREDKK